ncbi:YHYH domain-containing protein [Acinetobacter sp. ANC 5054]|nr:YHYH domain-containing protein [Acinetobacter sp. ANC 5054]
MKRILLASALLCCIGQVFAHSSGTSGKQGCHQHAPNNLPHCH